MATNDRPTVGPADPETRRKKLREALDKPSGSDVGKSRPKPAEPAKPKKKGTSSLRDLLNPKVERERRVRGEDESISEAVDRGVEMGTEAEKKRR